MGFREGFEAGRSPRFALNFRCLGQKVLSDRLACSQAPLQNHPVTAAKAKASSNSYTVGVDLGGTKAAAAVVNASGKIIAETTRPTVPPWMADADLRTNAVLSPEDVRKHIAYVMQAMADAV